MSGQQASGPYRPNTANAGLPGLIQGQEYSARGGSYDAPGARGRRGGKPSIWRRLRTRLRRSGRLDPA